MKVIDFGEVKSYIFKKKNISLTKEERNELFLNLFSEFHIPDPFEHNQRKVGIPEHIIGDTAYKPHITHTTDCTEAFT